MSKKEKWWNQKTPDQNIFLPGDPIDELTEIANKYKLSMIDVLRTFTQTGILMEQHKNEGGKIYLQTSTGEITEVVVFKKLNDNEDTGH